MTTPPLFQESELPTEANGLTVPEPPDVTGRRVCLIIPHTGFRDEELFQIKSHLERSRVKVFVACSSTTMASGMFGSEITPDILLAHVNPVDFDAIILVGGFGIDRYFKHSQLHQVVREAYRLEKIVAAISTASSILALAGLLKGRKATTWVGPTNDKYLKILRLSGCKFTGVSVEVDWPLITADDSDALMEFSEVLVEALAEVIRLEAEEAEQEIQTEQAQAMEEPHQARTDSGGRARFKVVEPGPEVGPGAVPEATPHFRSPTTTPTADERGVGPASAPTTLPRFMVLEPGPGVASPTPTRVEQVIAQQPQSSWARPPLNPRSTPVKAHRRVKPNHRRTSAGPFY